MDLLSGEEPSEQIQPTGESTPSNGENRFASQPKVDVLTDPGTSESGVLHTSQQIELRRQERERDALAAAYARYVESSPTPITFEQYVNIVRQMHHE